MENTSFYIDEYAVDLKQHINLSEHAWLIINEDIKNFYGKPEQESFSGFLNIIFKNFYQTSNATIYLRCMEKKEELEKLYSTEEFKNIDKKTISMFIEKYAEVYKNDLIKQALSFPLGHGEKFRINKENLELLRESSEAKNYGGTIGLYLKAIFEEYSRKPTFIREQIFFNNIIRKIKSAIENEKKVKITLLEKINLNDNSFYNRKFYVSPYSIVQDKTNTFNYLIGFAEELKEIVNKDSDNKQSKTNQILEKIPACFRISRIVKIDVMESMGAHISKEHSSEFEKMLVERGPMYMASEPINIKVKFSDKGLEYFKRQLFMRPQFYTVDPKDKHIYDFRCTERQGINYFFKFGWDIEILEPISLKQKFKQMYERALKIYQGIERETILKDEEATSKE